MIVHIQTEVEVVVEYRTIPGTVGLKLIDSNVMTTITNDMHVALKDKPSLFSIRMFSSSKM